HFDEVTRPVRPGVQIPLLGAPIAPLAPAGCGDLPPARCERGKDRVEPRHHGRFAADHQAVAALEPPDAARRANVEVVKAFLLQGARTPDVVLPKAIAAMEDAIVRLQQSAELGDATPG